MRTPTLVLCLLALGLTTSGCRTPLKATPPGDSGRWAVTKYLVRVYEAPEPAAVEAAERYLHSHGFEVEEARKESKSSEVVHLFHGFTAGGRLAYHLGQGTSLILRIRRRLDSPGLVVVEAKHGPGYTQAETAAILDGYELVLQTVMGGGGNDGAPAEAPEPSGEPQSEERSVLEDPK